MLCEPGLAISFYLFLCVFLCVYFSFCFYLIIFVSVSICLFIFLFLSDYFSFCFSLITSLSVYLIIFLSLFSPDNFSLYLFPSSTVSVFKQHFLYPFSTPLPQISLCLNSYKRICFLYSYFSLPFSRKIRLDVSVCTAVSLIDRCAVSMFFFIASTLYRGFTGTYFIFRV